ncbi:MAG TPA: hypothetical protein VF857_07175 [Spirochaetota bacterium]
MSDLLKPYCETDCPQNRSTMRRIILSYTKCHANIEYFPASAMRTSCCVFAYAGKSHAAQSYLNRPGYYAD